MNEIKIFSPATVANVACGFDVLGFCLNELGDDMIVRKTQEKGVKISLIEGFKLPLEVHKNVAGVSAMALYKDANPQCGFEIEIYKRIKPGSGVGSSAASAAGSVYAMNELLGKPYNKTQLAEFAMKGEALASASEHADNIAPGIFGGFTLVKSTNPLMILQIPTPLDLYATIIHPQIEIKTSEARKLLPTNIPLSQASQQWANLGGLIHALHTNDYILLQACLEDVIIEPLRKQCIPYFDDVKMAATLNGALGCAISGSGPSIFALSKGIETAKKVENGMQAIYSNTDIAFRTFVSSISPNGVKTLKHS
ncbi:homoserine kinase [Flavobacteriaceae bacterium]|jgi:homoserine kinase|nr:homoserine kinase [Flavobacteriaceae bacterium]